MNGIKSIELASMDVVCVIQDEKQAIVQAAWEAEEAAREKLLGEQEGENMQKTLLYGCGGLVVMALITAYMCVCISTDLKERLNGQYPLPLNEEEQEMANAQKYDYSAVDGSGPGAEGEGEND